MPRDRCSIQVHFSHKVFQQLQRIVCLWTRQTFFAITPSRGTRNACPNCFSTNIRPVWKESFRVLRKTTKPTIQAALFDFDYTLADSSKGAVECINYAFDKMGLAQHPSENICRTIGLSLNDTFTTLAGQQLSARCSEFSKLFVQRADEVMVDLTLMYESVLPSIVMLRESGLRLGIVSTKYRYRIEAILERENLLQFFEVVIGGEDVEQHKPDPEGMFKAIELLQCSPQSVVYVGDSVADAEVAKRAGVQFVLVLSGVTPREDFAGYKTIGVLENLSELPTLVRHFRLPDA